MFSYRYQDTSSWHLNSFQKLHDKISVICSLKYVNWPIITALKSKLQFEFIFCVLTFVWVVQTHKSIYPNTCIFTQRVLIVYTERKIYRIELPIRQFKICHLLGTFGSLIIYIFNKRREFKKYLYSYEFCSWHRCLSVLFFSTVGFNHMELNPYFLETNIMQISLLFIVYFCILSQTCVIF